MNQRKTESVSLSVNLNPSCRAFTRSMTSTSAVPIEMIKEIRSGHDARYYRSQFKFPEDVEDRWLTIVYVIEGTYKTLHMLATTQDLFKMWDSCLRRLYAIRQGLMSGLGNLEMRQTIWEMQYWKAADRSGDKKLNFDEAQKLCLRLNVNSPKGELQRLFKVRLLSNQCPMPSCTDKSCLIRRQTPSTAIIWTSPIFSDL